MHVDPEYEQLMAEVALTDVFADPRVRVWRSLPDRENATLDHVRSDRTTVRLHVKRYPASNGAAVAAEVAGHDRLKGANIPTAPLVAHDRLPDGRSFAIFLDLAGFAPADKWLTAHPGAFDQLLAPTADVAAALHAAGLHHRDLYLCHFMVSADVADVRLIDVTRVGRLSNPITRRRWVVKDLAQFWYSTTKHADVTDSQRDAWLDRYAERRGVSARRLKSAVVRKAAAIARHDVTLNRNQPTRNVSIPAPSADVHPGLH